jgi:23S rRNA (cytosine1962-C5)-methyltransferase
VKDGGASPGAVVRVADVRGTPLGFAFWSSRSEIRLRMIERGETLAEGFLGYRIERALRWRETVAAGAEAYRVVHGEGDGLPSLVVDRYGDYLSIQTLSQGTERAKADMVRVDLRKGQKTGLFLDRRENHLAARQYARGRVLDGFTYDGGFALQVARQSDEVTAVDLSAESLERVKANASLNGLANVTARDANVFDLLKELDQRGERFDTVILDPPAFAKSKDAVEKAARGYKEINLPQDRAPGRLPRHVLVLLPRPRGGLRGHPRRRRSRRAGGGHRRREAPPGPGPPGRARGPGDALPQMLRAAEAGLRRQPPTGQRSSQRARTRSVM